ncbi:MAG: acyltransferase, partial [Clostridia bacterium]|nr:acyltransferase [Clostridia bacterium]
LFLFIFFNDSIGYYHLWYLGALLYVLLIFMLAKKVLPKWETVAYIITPLLIIANFILSKYALLHIESADQAVFTRNFLFIGVPCFSIGVFLKNNENKIKSIKNNNILSVFLVILFIGTTLLERYILLHLNANGDRDFYISSALLATILMIVFSKDSWNSDKLTAFKKIGRKYSTLIYIIHPALIFVIKMVVTKLNFESVYNLIAPIAVFIASLVFAICYYFVKDKIKNMIKNKSVFRQS